MSIMDYPPPRVGFRRSTLWNINQWPHLASLYASTHNLDEEGKYPDPIMGQDNVFDPSEPYGAYRYYIHPTGARSEFSLEEPTYVNRPVYKDEESRSSDYTSGESLKRGSTCRVLLCVFLVLSFIGVVVAAITLAVLLSKTPRSRKLADAPIEEYESMASLLGRTFNESLLDKDSDDYKQLEKELCIALEQIFTEPDSPVKHEFAGCEVIEFAEGSVLARFRIKLQPKLPEGFKKELRIRQKIEEHFSKKIKEHGPWQSVKFNPDFIRRFVKIEPPKVETSPPTTSPTSEGTTSAKTVKPGIIDVTTKSINITESTEPATTASPSETVTIGATTIKDDNLTVSTAQILEGTIVTSNVTQPLAPSTESPVSTIDDMVIIKETKASVSNVSEVEITNFTVPETTIKVTKDVKMTTVADVINVTTTTIDPFILFENVTFPFNDSTSTDFGIDDVGNATKAEEITTATVDAGTITTTAKVGTESTASPAGTTTLVDNITETTTGDMKQTTVTPVSPVGTTVIEGVTSATTVEMNQTAVVTERPSTVEQSSETVTPVDKTNVTQSSITTESALNDTTDFASFFNETTEFAIDPTQTFEITTPVDKTMDITTSTAETPSPTVPEQTSMAVGSTGSVDVTTLFDTVTNESISDKISTMRDDTTLGATGMLPSDTTLKPVSDITLTTVQDKTTQGKGLTTESVSEVQSTTETLTGDLLANITNTTEFGFLETTTAENVTGPDMVFITDSTSNDTTTITSEKATTSAPVVTHSITTDSVSMTTMPQQAAITTEALTDSTMLAATTGIHTVDSLTTLEGQNITTDGQMPETTNATGATPQTTQLISDIIQKDTVAAVDRAPQTFVMQDVTQQAGTTTEVPTLEQTTAFVDNITVTDGGVTITQEVTTQIYFTEITTIDETSVLPGTTPSQTVSLPDETTLAPSQATVSPDQGLTTSLTDTTQEGTTSDTMVAATTLSVTTPALSAATVDTATTMRADTIQTTEADTVVTTAQTELQQNVTTAYMFENMTATDMITTTDALNETVPIDLTSGNMTTTVFVSVDLTTAPGDTTTVESVPVTTMFPQAASTQADMTATAVDQATTQIDTKSTNITASMTETTVSDTAPSTPGQSMEVMQSTQMPSQLTDTITTIQPTGITTLVTDTMVNVTEMPTQMPEQTTMGNTATTMNITTDFTTMDVLLDNTTATETMDLANFTTATAAQDKLTTSKQISNTLMSDKITDFTTSAPDNDTTQFSDTTMLPEQTPTMPDTAMSTMSSNDSIAMTTSRDGSMNVSGIVSTDSGVTVDVLTQQPQTTESDAVLSTDQSLLNGTDAAQNASLDTTQAPASTDQPATTLIAESTMGATGDVLDTTVKTDSSTAAPFGTTTNTTEDPDQTVVPVVDMATTDMLLNFTDMFYNVTDLYENVTEDVFTTETPKVTTSKPVTSDQSVTNVTDSVQQVTTLLVNLSEPVTDASVTDGVTAMPPDNGTVMAELTTQSTRETTTTILSVNATTEYPVITDGLSPKANATMIMDPTTQGTLLSNTTLAGETFTTDSSATEQPTNISGLISEDSNATFTIKVSTKTNVTKVSSSNVTAESLAPEELSNITSAPRIDSKMSETINMTKSPFTENATIYDMTFENTTDFYYLNETTTSVISNATISDSATVILPDLSSSNETVDIKPSSNETTLSSEVKANESAITFEMFSSLPLN